MDFGRFPHKNRRGSRVRRENVLDADLAFDPTEDKDGSGGKEEDGVEQTRKDVEVGEGVEQERARLGGRGRERDERREKVHRLSQAMPSVKATVK